MMGVRHGPEPNTVDLKRELEKKDELLRELDDDICRALACIENGGTEEQIKDNLYDALARIDNQLGSDKDE